MQPLNQLLTHPKDKSAPLEWTDEALSAFHKTKEALAEATLLTHPKLNAPTCLMTDASNTAVGVSASAICRQLVVAHRFFLEGDEESGNSL